MKCSILILYIVHPWNGFEVSSLIPALPHSLHGILTKNSCIRMATKLLCMMNHAPGKDGGIYRYTYTLLPMIMTYKLVLVRNAQLS